MHNIEHYTYNENIKRDWVQKQLDHRAAMEDYQEGCAGLGKPIRWLENIPVCDDYEAAEDMIKKNDRGWYDQLAVRYYEPVRGFSDSKEKALQGKVKDAFDAYRKKDDVWAKGLSSEFVGCRTCGSRLKRKYVTTNHCPLCRSDLRPETTKKAVRAAKDKWEKAKKTLNQYIMDHAKKQVMWLVKIEYHT